MKVSVWMTAYNHEKYLAQCLDSVLNQKTNFDFEIVLGEDCSKDRTREIVLEYHDKYPDIFSLFLPKKNIGMMEMDVATWSLCKGEYLALLNGDDYWTDENKLQIQTDLLDNDPETVICFHKAKVENETDGSSFETVYLEPTDTMPPESLLMGYNPIMTPTVMIRNIFKIPEWFGDLPYGDMPLYLMLAQEGKIKYIDRLMSVYRIHSDGQWQGETVYNNLLKDLKFYEVMQNKLGARYEELIKAILAMRYFDLTLIDIKENRNEKAKKFLEKLISLGNEFTDQYEKEIDMMKKILYGSADKGDFSELLNKEIKWKVN